MERIANLIVSNLREAGYDAAATVHPRAHDAMMITVNLALPLRIRMHCDGTRYVFRGFVDTPRGLTVYDTPSLGSTMVATDGNARRAARQIIARIIEPAKEPLQALVERASEQAERAKDCDALEERLRAMGIYSARYGDVPGDASRTECAFSINRNGALVTGTVRPDGSIYIKHGHVNGAAGLEWLAKLAGSN